VEYCVFAVPFAAEFCPIINLFWRGSSKSGLLIVELVAIKHEVNKFTFEN
jgi:hypothetical protein